MLPVPMLPFSGDQLKRDEGGSSPISRGCVRRGESAFCIQPGFLRHLGSLYCRSPRLPNEVFAMTIAARACSVLNSLERAMQCERCSKRTSGDLP